MDTDYTSFHHYFNLSTINFFPLKLQVGINTYRNQSTVRRRLTSFVGKPAAVSTSNMVTKPALGTLAAPILANVAVIL